MKATHFNPGCALSLYKPEAEQRILEYLKSEKENGDIKLHKVCCHHEPRVDNGSHIINVCAGCDRRFRSLYDGVSTISLWEILDKRNDFPFPDHSGKKMSVHDACPIREKPQVHQAIRSLLKKMNIEVIETEKHGTNSVCCGDDFYPSLPLEEVHEKMKSRAESMPCDDVVVYCVSCVKSMHIGGKKAHYMIDLLFNEETTPGVYDTVLWHEQLQEYIDNHK